MPEVDCPTLIVHGTRDEVVPIEGSRAYAASRANVRLVAEATDILLPLTGAARTSVPPTFVEPGFGAAVRLLVSL